MNTKQTITGKQDNSLETPRCQEKDFTLSRGWRLERRRCGAGQCVVFIFCSCQNSQVFLFPLLPALNERHLIEFDGFTLIRAAAVVAALLPLWLHLPYLMPQILVHDFYCLLYYCISRGICFKYALSLCLSEPMAFVPAAPAVVCCADFIADFYVRRLLCFTFFAPLFNPLPTAVVVVAVAACVDRKCLIFKSVLHFVARLRVSFFLISFFVFVCVFAVFFGNNRLARFAFPFSLPCCFGVLVFGLLVSISPGCRLFVRYMQMCRQLFALRICFSRRSCYAYVFVF